MGARRYKQSTRLDEQNDEDEKEKLSFYFSFFDTKITQEKGGGDGGFRRSRADGLRIWGHHNGSPPRRRAPSADAQAGVVRTAEEWATTVDNAAAWSNEAPANGTEVAQYNNQPVGARGYITNNALVRAGARARMREEEKEIPSFFSSSFDVVTVTTVRNAAPADDGKAPAKDVSEKEAVDETAGGNGLFGERRTEEVA